MTVTTSVYCEELKKLVSKSDTVQYKDKFYSIHRIDNDLAFFRREEGSRSNIFLFHFKRDVLTNVLAFKDVNFKSAEFKTCSSNFVPFSVAKAHNLQDAYVIQLQLAQIPADDFKAKYKFNSHNKVDSETNKQILSLLGILNDAPKIRIAESSAASCLEILEKEIEIARASTSPGNVFVYAVWYEFSIDAGVLFPANMPDREPDYVAFSR